jgi:hypothetical protein
MVGKSTFKLKITDLTSKQPVIGLKIKLMPLMHMPTMSHSTPVGGIVDNGDGTYTCTVYYLMASGPNMGFWEMQVMISSGMNMASAETAVFHPAVMMAMGDTARANLNGVQDLDATSSKRSYMLFNDGLVSGMTSTFNLFIATKESMMNFPAVSGGTVLSSPTGTWAVDPATTSLQASLDSTFPQASTITGVDNGKGHWALTKINGLSSGMTNTIYVRLVVNNELKTAGTSTTAAGYATFAVTPSSKMGM